MPTTKALDPYCDFLFVDNSVAVILHVVRTAKGVDLDMMIRHGQAVMPRLQTGVVIIELPAGSYENSPKQVLATERLVLDKNGADGVKLEGGTQIIRYVARIMNRILLYFIKIGLLYCRPND
jgi:3-methyl-2-oxobutanoate hydroxymethyltransferase